MVEVYKLTKRHTNEAKELSRELKHIVMFSTSVGHGVGKIDFSQKVLELDDDEFNKIVENSGKYAKFKLGNLSKYFEIELFAEHINKLLPELADGEFKEILADLKEGYFIIRKSF
ncbi:formate hydrogenlyase maturation HycH family protein [Campylobacter geochelonis]|uniref:Formate hydrogenlyase maturation protein HycH n=1 Tax=Campylobacter geochelonis TaxID=1780362 RepID=A0A128EKU0_9BACT|nr:formate hydrogenlyase maturation HycH family protein [Campylobacter geochelonis]QKF72139.1 formate hydrogenlyase family maturation protein [Campylobacter geochelonis]CZE45974.1 formate hydrogenlyase maturation protein HycH [Campylobacter geochelonis]CZE46653.1 formate hydrogenlyase maturation protein HycH [Campylobacter geochelonis]CZE49777.1 formate hydrogenlyase maturation protein HycH [Campylobacter geochelonis]